MEMAVIGIVVAIVVLLYVLAIHPSCRRAAREAKREVRYYAHRGLYDNNSDAPENSLRAFALAAEAGYGIELDVRLTKDGVPVVFHDAELGRVCGCSGSIEDLNAAQTDALRLLGTDQKVPRLQEVLSLVAGRVPLLVEYKMEQMDATVCMRADRLLNSYPGEYCMESFHPFALLWYRQNRPGILRGILSTDYRDGRSLPMTPLHFCSRHLLFNFFAQPNFVAYDRRVKTELSRTLCSRLYRIPLAAWTVKSREQLEELRPTYDWFIFEGFRP